MHQPGEEARDDQALVLEDASPQPQGRHDAERRVPVVARPVAVQGCSDVGREALALAHGVLRIRHASLGVVATLGLGRGIFQYKGLVITGLLAWLMHRGYHVLAIPTWERKLRVLVVWLTALVTGRDIVSLLSVQDPRGAFVSGGVPHAR